MAKIRRILSGVIDCTSTEISDIFVFQPIESNADIDRCVLHYTVEIVSTGENNGVLAYISNTSSILNPDAETGIVVEKTSRFAEIRIHYQIVEFIDGVLVQRGEVLDDTITTDALTYYKREIPYAYYTNPNSSYVLLNNRNTNTVYTSSVSAQLNANGLELARTEQVLTDTCKVAYQIVSYYDGSIAVARGSVLGDAPVVETPAGLFPTFSKNKLQMFTTYRDDTGTTEAQVTGAYGLSGPGDDLLFYSGTPETRVWEYQVVAYLDNTEVQHGAYIAWSDTNETLAISETDLSRSIFRLDSWNYSTGVSLDAVSTANENYTVFIDSTTNTSLDITRPVATSNIDVYYTVVQFEQGAFIQPLLDREVITGSVTMAIGNGLQEVILPDIDITKSFISVSFKVLGGTNRAGMLFNYYLEEGKAVFSRFVIDVELNIQYSVYSFAQGVSVIHGNFESGYKYPSPTFIFEELLPNSVTTPDFDASKSIAIVNSSLRASDLSLPNIRAIEDEYDFLAYNFSGTQGDFSNKPTLKFYVSEADTFELNKPRVVHYQIISFEGNTKAYSISDTVFNIKNIDIRLGDPINIISNVTFKPGFSMVSAEPIVNPIYEVVGTLTKPGVGPGAPPTANKVVNPSPPEGVEYLAQVVYPTNSSGDKVDNTPIAVISLSNSLGDLIDPQPSDGDIITFETGLVLSYRTSGAEIVSYTLESDGDLVLFYEFVGLYSIPNEDPDGEPIPITIMTPPELSGLRVNVAYPTDSEGTQISTTPIAVIDIQGDPEVPNNTLISFNQEVSPLNYRVSGPKVVGYQVINSGATEKEPKKPSVTLSNGDIVTAKIPQKGILAVEKNVSTSYSHIIYAQVLHLPDQLGTRVSGLLGNDVTSNTIPLGINNVWVNSDTFILGSKTDTSTFSDLFTKIIYTDSSFTFQKPAAEIEYSYSVISFAIQPEPEISYPLGYASASLLDNYIQLLPLPSRGALDMGYVRYQDLDSLSLVGDAPVINSEGLGRAKPADLDEYELEI